MVTSFRCGRRFWPNNVTYIILLILLILSPTSKQSYHPWISSPIEFCNNCCNVTRKDFGLTDGNLSLESGPIN